ncbi:MAG: serine/threonine-protein kinase [Pirellulales bacterium]
MLSCPTNLQLLECIGERSANSVTSATQSTSWIAEHLEHCLDCQARLQVLVDDEQLGRWRDIAKNDPFYSTARDELAVIASAKELDSSPRTTNKELQNNAAIETINSSADFEKRQSAKVGKVLGNLKLVREIGRGGMATVFEAHDTVLNRKVAVKQLDGSRADATSYTRFVREAKLLAAVRHPNVVAIYEVVDQPDFLPYYVMELIEGGTLKSVSKGRFDFGELATIFSNVAIGLQAVHATGVVHRDIKPSNILLDSKPGSGQTVSIPKLADFGLARSTDQQMVLTQANVLAGTPAYMSPEQVAGIEPTFATDIYSLGVTLYESLTGELPFRGSTRNLMQQISAGEFSQPRKLDADIPLDLETICMKCMRLQPADRYGCANEVAEDLQRFSSGRPILARPLNRREQLWRWAKRNPSTAWQLSIIASLLLIVAVGASIAAGLLSAAGRNLRAENIKVQQSQQEALKLAEVATNQRQLAIDSLNTLVNQVQQELANRPANLQLRRALLQVAFDGLAKITRTENSDEQDLTTIAAHRKMSQISRLLGNTSEALSNVNKAIELAEISLQRSPNDRTVERELGAAYFEKGLFYRASSAHDLALAQFELAYKIRHRVSQQNPNDFTALGELLISQHSIADANWYLGKQVESKKIFAEILDLTRQHLVREEVDPQLRRMFGIACGRNAAILAHNSEVDQARLLHEESLATARDLLNRNPDSLEYQSDVGFALNRLTRFEKSLRNTELALKLSIQTKDCFLKIANAAPDDVHSQSLVGTCWHLESEILVDSGRFDDAIKAANAAREIHLKFADKNPDTARFWQLAAEESILIGSIDCRRARFEATAKHNLEAIEYLIRSQKTLDQSASGRIQILIEELNTGNQAIELMKLPADSLMEQIAQRPQVMKLALTLQALQLAHEGKAEEAVARIELVRGSMGIPEPEAKQGYSQCLYNMLRASGIVHGLLINKPAEDLSESQVRTQLIQRALEIAKDTVAIFLKDSPLHRDTILSDADLKSLMRVPEFQQAVTEKKIK